MGRYKSVLMAEQDARDFPYHVLVPVPPNGLGKRMDVIAAWIDLNVGSDWRMHGHLGKDGHMACYMFRSEEEAGVFRLAMETEEV